MIRKNPKVNQGQKNIEAQTVIFNISKAPKSDFLCLDNKENIYRSQRSWFLDNLDQKKNLGNENEGASSGNTEGADPVPDQPNQNGLMPLIMTQYIVLYKEKRFERGLDQGQLDVIDFTPDHQRTGEMTKVNQMIFFSSFFKSTYP